MKRRVGVYTFYKNYNYGSLLQCYALQKALSSLNVDPYVIDIYSYGTGKLVSKITHGLDLIFRMICYPQLISEVKKYSKESKRSVGNISIQSKRDFQVFISENIDVIRVSKKEIQTFAKSSENLFFISGSDQVWSIAGFYINPNGFLLFAPKQKRFSYAASFGADSCPNWNKRIIRKYIRDMRSVSVRENIGITLASEFGCVSVLKHIDPVFLLSTEDWDELIESNDEKKYQFAFFLNSPSELALAHIKKMRECSDVELLYGPYQFETLDNIGAQYIGFPPKRFLALIKNAEKIYTDSFHSTAFAIIFSKQFYVYERAYQHTSTQNNRIESLLECFGLQNRLVINIEDISEQPYNSKDIIDRERSRSIEYLKNIIKEMDKETL